MLAFLLGEALRDLRRAGRAAASAVLLIALALTAVGAFWLVSTNLGRALGQWSDGVRIVVFLTREAASRDALIARVSALPGVASVRYVDKAEALATLKRALGKQAGVVEQLPANPLPASLEVTPSAAGATEEGAQALLAQLAALPETEEVAGSLDWADRLARWRRLLQTVGLGLGGVLAVAAVLTVTTATTLVLHARRHETEIMRLVGAPELVIRIPLLLQGGLQGLLGAGLAVSVLVVGYRLLESRLEPLVALTLGLPRLSFLTPAAVLGLVLAGTLLGAAGGLLGRPRGGEER